MVFNTGCGVAAAKDRKVVVERVCNLIDAPCQGDLRGLAGEKRIALLVCGEFSGISYARSGTYSNGRPGISLINKALGASPRD